LIFVRRQRYTSEAALQRMPKTTDELLSFMHGQSSARPRWAMGSDRGLPTGWPL